MPLICQINTFQDAINAGNLVRKYNLETDAAVRSDLMLDGRLALCFGIIAGGCNYMTWYPMAPSTNLGMFLAQKAEEFSMIDDQSEDEISAINKALGASFVGARALVATADGGFCLMVEGLSLCGMAEIPLVIIIGQRPGPATGLPTRMEQGALNLVLHARHGIFSACHFCPQ